MMDILIADDDPISRLALESCLRQWEHTVVVATNGEDAWEVLQRPDSPSLAILDWMMPGMDGLEVCRKARDKAATSETHRALYLILLTGRRNTTDLVAGLEAGAD